MVRWDCGGGRRDEPQNWRARQQDNRALYAARVLIDPGDSWRRFKRRWWSEKELQSSATTMVSHSGRECCGSDDSGGTKLCCRPSFSRDSYARAKFSPFSAANGALMKVEDSRILKPCGERPRGCRRRVETLSESVAATLIKPCSHAVFLHDTCANRFSPLDRW